MGRNGGERGGGVGCVGSSPRNLTSRKTRPPSGALPGTLPPAVSRPFPFCICKLTAGAPRRINIERAMLNRPDFALHRHCSARRAASASACNDACTAYPRLGRFEHARVNSPSEPL